MIEVYLFDWGDTLMIDFPGVPGKMSDWEKVEAVPGAMEVLENLSKHAEIYVATGAADSTESDIERAFERVGLSQYISGYFCQSNLGVAKGSSDFLIAILAKLQKLPENVAMIGDSLTKDIEPAISAGIKPIWFSPGYKGTVPGNARIIDNLKELCL